MALYSEVVMDHFMHPRNVGTIENADGVTILHGREEEVNHGKE